MLEQPPSLSTGPRGAFPTMFHSTAILAVRHRDQTVMASDGQVTFGDTIVKQSARKIRRLYQRQDSGRLRRLRRGLVRAVFAIRGEAGTVSWESRALGRQLAKDWRTDRLLRRLEAMLIVMDARATYLLSGNGDLIEPDDGIIAIGSGGAYAMAAAKALAKHSDMPASAIAEEAMNIAGAICIYSNNTLTIESL